MKVSWSREARDDLREIGLWIADDNPTAALAMVRRIRSAARDLSAHPHKGRPGRVRGTRELVVSGTRYLLVYQVREADLQIAAVFDGARLWPDAFQ